jgi:hypothetical protein
METIIKKLLSELKFRTDNIMFATDGYYHLTVVMGNNETIYTLRDENDEIVKTWKE